MTYIQKNTREFRNSSTALFLGAFNTFAILYSTQPIFTNLAEEFNLSPASASLSLSAASMTLAISLLIVGSISEVYGRKIIMSASITLSSVLAIITAFVPNYTSLLAIRVLQGFASAGLPAIAMAYISEEFEPKNVGAAMGLYISGNTVGGMAGRLIIGTLTNMFNWRFALGCIGIVGLTNSILFLKLLPSSKNFVPRKLEINNLMKTLINHVKNTRLLCLYGMGFLLMGSFVSLYNYIGFELIAPPYNVNPTLVSFIFVLYLVGTFSSTFLSRMSDTYGRFNIIRISMVLMLIGASTTLMNSLAMKILGIGILTFGYFGCHSIISAWVGRIASHDKAQASSLYLFFYYAGSSVGGTTSGLFLESKLKKKKLAEFSKLYLYTTSNFSHTTSIFSSACFPIAFDSLEK
ncbi:MAG: arabinose efflux permease family protein [Sedimentibacter sp.]|nr:arabinose efflux permease family protein [Sedimentibacter sp.]